MEETPKGTFQDELEWCISQLETGLLRRNPTPKQEEETRRILGVLRSHKAPFVKKRQVMHHVFGDYRLKMAQERKKAAIKPKKVQIQPGPPLVSGSVMYGKQSTQPSKASSSWFTPSDNSFRFGFVVSESPPEETNGTTGEKHGGEEFKKLSAGNEPSPKEDCKGIWDFSPAPQGPEFAFNFAIPASPPLLSAGVSPGKDIARAASTEVDHSRRKVMVTLESSFCPKPGDAADTMGGGEGRNGECSAQEASKLAPAQVAPTDTAIKEANVPVCGGLSKRKKKKQQQPSKVEPGPNANGDSRQHVKDAPDQAELRQSDEQMKREVDWCVEQLKLGLKTRKSTPQQMDEALRTIKTLCSEKAVLAKKRQVMRAMFGDYRKKMAEEKQKQLKLMQTASKVARIAEVPEDAFRKSSRIFKKSAEVAKRSQSLTAASQQYPASLVLSGTHDACSSMFTSTHPEFRFNFF